MPIRELPQHNRGSFCEPITKLIIEYTEKGVPLKFASEASGVHFTTVNRWRVRGEEIIEREKEGEPPTEKEYLYAKFALDYAAARAKAVASRIGQIDAAGVTGQWQASAWWLERQVPEHFAKVDRHELTGAGGGPIELAQAELIAQAQQIVQEKMKEIESGGQD